jgi:GAF domain-containing protein
METAAKLTNAALEKAIAITRQPMGNLQLIDWNLGYLEIVAQRGFSPEFLERFQIVRKTDGCACGRALRLRETVVVEDVNEDPAFFSFRDAAQQAGFRSVQSTPLISRNGAFVGMISTHGSDAPTSAQLQQLRMLADETANELIFLQSRGGRIPALSPSAVIHRVENVSGHSSAIIAGVARVSELLKQSSPDTFLGKQHHEFIPPTGE